MIEKLGIWQIIYSQTWHLKELFGHRKFVHYLLSKLANWSQEIANCQFVPYLTVR